MLVVLLDELRHDGSKRRQRDTLRVNHQLNRLGYGIGSLLIKSRENFHPEIGTGAIIMLVWHTFLRLWYGNMIRLKVVHLHKRSRHLRKSQARVQF